MTNDTRQYSFLDQICINIDRGLRALHQCPITTERDDPAIHINADSLTLNEKKQSANLMRVNHTGEVCAQALYQGQALTARTAKIREQMYQASVEENDHLAWCGARLNELNSHTSYLNPLWYAGSFALGLTAGVIGDQWSLGFLAETEHQVVKHLETHLTKLPINDHKSRAIVTQMIIDEHEHETNAIDAGAHQLPNSIKSFMRLAAKLMTNTVRWI